MGELDEGEHAISTVGILLAVLVVFSSVWFLGFKYVLSRRVISGFIRALGVGWKRVAKTVKELDRKTFHLMGLCIPSIYFFGLKFVPWFDRNMAILILGAHVFVYWTLEMLRWVSPSFKKIFASAFGGVMRESEKHKFTGMGFYLLGNFICVVLFPPIATIASMLYLILGDLSAALIGISFGKTKIGKKSLEGFLACFGTCFILSMILFWSFPLPEYLSLCGSLTAALVELLAPFEINDNLSIPVTSAFAITIAAYRVNNQVGKTFIDLNIGI